MCGKQPESFQRRLCNAFRSEILGDVLGALAACLPTFAIRINLSKELRLDSQRFRSFVAGARVEVYMKYWADVRLACDYPSADR